MPSRKYTDLPSSPEQFTVTPAAAQKLLEFRPDDLAMFPIRISTFREGPFLRHEMSFATSTNIETDVLVENDKPGVVMDRLTAARLRGGRLDWESEAPGFRFTSDDWPSSDMTEEPWQKDVSPEQAPIAYDLLQREMAGQGSKEPTAGPTPQATHKSSWIATAITAVLIGLVVLMGIGAIAQQNVK